MDVCTYFLQRASEVRGLSLGVDGDDPMNICAEEEGTDGQRGTVFGNLVLDEDAYLAVSEKVVVTAAGAIHREEYAYFLIVDGDEIWGYERDLSHDPAIHRHTRNHERVEGDVISFRAAAECAWATLSKIRGGG